MPVSPLNTVEVAQKQLILNILRCFLLLFVSSSFGANGIEPSPQVSQEKIHPLKRFEGRWVVDQKGFSMVWDKQTIQTIPLTGQVSDCRILNTPDALLCEVATPNDPTANSGNITWVWDRSSNKVHWLSHFSPSRYGVGTGELDEKDNLVFRVHFSDEPKSTYRIYQWTWQHDGSYALMSRQYDQDNNKTGNWYGGRFVALTEQK
ncbi:hypothetical protein [Aliiglaciecola sp. M165]|uniref:hypothetical protein n=1 Tax=Aliiglaciecola sp. M165 TaxID=2593649 RepID=UPI00117FAACF|nr:hypothetical protein [Aliiglaciecola sp. M165]TRY31301.1 hypothetical protein FM019_10500 [Aliiglaciecola sp. M165]